MDPGTDVRFPVARISPAVIRRTRRAASLSVNDAVLARNVYYRIVRSATLWFAFAIMISSVGCTGLRLPAIDPTGERIFLPAPNSTTFDDGSSFRGPAWTSAPQAPLCGTPGASSAVVPYSLNTPTPPLFGPGVSNPYANPGVNPYAQAVPFAAERLTGQTSTDPRDGIPGQLRLSSQRLVVPVGQEVIVRAAICGSDGYLVTREPIEWSLSPDSVGTIVEVDQQDKALWRQLLRRPPTKTASDFARGITSRAPQIVPRGSASPYDDLQLVRGETWISLTSASVGQTHLHCLAPTVAGWEHRRASTTIQWVGPNGPAPTPAAPGVSVPTPAPPPANTPPTLPVDPEPSLPATRPDVKLTIEGPGQAKADDQLTYRIKVRNNGNADADEVVVSSKIPLGLKFIDSDTQVSEFGDRLVWSIGTLQRGQSREIKFRHRADRSGQMRVPGILDYRGAARTEEYVDTNIALNPLSVRVLGPETAMDGQPLRLQIQVTNHSNRDLSNLDLTTTYDPKLFHPNGSVDRANPAANIAIKAPIDVIRANQMRTFDLDFQIRGEGRLCYDVLVKAPDGSEATTENCVMVGPGAAFDGRAFGGPVAPNRRAAFSVQKTGPIRMSVGGRGLYKIRVVNTGSIPLTGMRVIDEFDGRLEPKDATVGVRRDGNKIFWVLNRLEVGQTQIFEVDCEARQPGRVCNVVTVTSAEGVTEVHEWCADVVGGGAALPSPSGQRAVATQFVVDKPNALEQVAPRSRSGFSPFQPFGSKRTQDRVTVAPAAAVAIAPQRPPGPSLPLPNVQPQSYGTTARPTPMAGDWNVDIRRSPNSQHHDRITYTVTITNHHAQAEQNIRLMIESPAGTRFADSINPPMIRASRRSSDGRTVEFIPVSSLRPDETATFQIVVQQLNSATGKFRAKVSSDRWPNGSVFTEK